MKALLFSRKLEYTKEMLIEFRKNVLGLEITRVEDNTTSAVPTIEVLFHFVLNVMF